MRDGEMIATGPVKYLKTLYGNYYIVTVFHDGNDSDAATLKKVWMSTNLLFVKDL